MDLTTTNEDIDWINSKLEWSQEFNNTTSFEEDWVFEKNLPDSDVADQLQKYFPENVEVNGGNLKIFAKKRGCRAE
jgi:hypothetical protein